MCCGPYTTVHGPWDTLGPFWPKSNEAKRGQTFGSQTTSGPTWPYFGPSISKDKKDQNPELARPLGPKPQVGLPGLILAHQSQRKKRTKTLKWPYFALVLANTRGHQTPFPRPFPQYKGRPFPIIGTQGCRNLGWGIYGIIYH
ncbi:hypothetical protein O181_035612 [Austropuccinia psidii MF-1]|uniref:Uncharacterized protein n=1 Tax=Austropuccinia psidii MF-1 TaxID=1389203 RepID=A0A9Q3H953_9BASI|nr:hypothetical protein [Austropuccinia psidii MF-1]